MEWIDVKGEKLIGGRREIRLRGFGLGGWLLPEGYMWRMPGQVDRPRRMEELIEGMCGAPYAAAFWKRYQDTFITQADMADMAARGFNCVRLPINARHADQAIHVLDRLIAWCRALDMYVIIDMHAAPGGQTGTNIDDSAHDQPELFTDERYQAELIQLWRALALRYADEPAVAGYDLLNEPLPPWQMQYAPLVLPLYRKLRDAIREVDKRHLLILEGVRWASDFSIFDELTAEEPYDERYLLQFHRYWSNPDREGIEPFTRQAARLRVPLLMGEGGENNADWYAAFFPMLEREGIHYSFWTYKKMSCDNSPVTFPTPEGWAELRDHVENGTPVQRARARSIWDEFLSCAARRDPVPGVINAMLLCPPVRIPAEAYARGTFTQSRPAGASLRESEAAPLVFADGHTGNVNYAQTKGEPSPESENVVLRLSPGDQVEYDLTLTRGAQPRVTLEGENVQNLSADMECLDHDHAVLRVSCRLGGAVLDAVRLA